MFLLNSKQCLYSQASQISSPNPLIFFSSMPMMFEPDTPKPWVVQKFGGTSIGKLLENITADIIPSYLHGNRVAIVCSARSGSSKSMGTTNLLLRSIDAVEDPACLPSLIDDLVDTLVTDHIAAANAALKQEDRDHVLLTKTCDEINRLCDELRVLLHASKVREYV